LPRRPVKLSSVLARFLKFGMLEHRGEEMGW